MEKMAAFTSLEIRYKQKMPITIVKKIIGYSRKHKVIHTSVVTVTSATTK